MLSNFVSIYFYIGVFVYLTIFSLMYMAGVDNLKKMMSEEDLKTLDIESTNFHVGLAIICILLWPILVTMLAKKNLN
jgi:hypothetical protein